MTSARPPLLIVPVRDRRQHRRILTIRNCAISMLSIAVVIASVSIDNNSKHGPATDYGRLFGKRVAAPKDSIERKADIINEGTVADQAAADPMLVAPAAREQLLMANSNVPANVPATTAAPVAPVAPAPARTAGEVTITGDGNGVAIVHPPATSSAPRKVLTGGIFKQQ
jgi:hypothetical protein